MRAFTSYVAVVFFFPDLDQSGHGRGPRSVARLHGGRRVPPHLVEVPLDACRLMFAKLRLLFRRQLLQQEVTPSISFWYNIIRFSHEVACV